MGKAKLTAKASTKTNTTAKVATNARVTKPQPQPFTAVEDQKIIDLKEEQHLGWKEIARQLPGRAHGTIQVRYCRTLSRRPDGPNAGVTTRPRAPKGAPSAIPDAKDNKLDAGQESDDNDVVAGHNIVADNNVATDNPTVAAQRPPSNRVRRPISKAVNYTEVAEDANESDISDSGKAVKGSAPTRVVKQVKGKALSKPKAVISAELAENASKSEVADEGKTVNNTETTRDVKELKGNATSKSKVVKSSETIETAGKEVAGGGDAANNTEPNNGVKELKLKSLKVTVTTSQLHVQQTLKSETQGKRTYAAEESPSPPPRLKLCLKRKGPEEDPTGRKKRKVAPSTEDIGAAKDRTSMRNLQAVKSTAKAVQKPVTKGTRQSTRLMVKATDDPQTSHTVSALQGPPEQQSSRTSATSVMTQEVPEVSASSAVTLAADTIPGKALVDLGADSDAEEAITKPTITKPILKRARQPATVDPVSEDDLGQPLTKKARHTLMNTPNVEIAAKYMYRKTVNDISWLEANPITTEQYRADLKAMGIPVADEPKRDPSKRVPKQTARAKEAERDSLVKTMDKVIQSLPTINQSLPTNTQSLPTKVQSQDTKTETTAPVAPRKIVTLKISGRVPAKVHFEDEAIDGSASGSTNALFPDVTKDVRALVDANGQFPESSLRSSANVRFEDKARDSAAKSLVHAPPKAQAPRNLPKPKRGKKATQVPIKKVSSDNWEVCGALSLDLDNKDPMRAHYVNPPDNRIVLYNSVSDSYMSKWCEGAVNGWPPVVEEKVTKAATKGKGSRKSKATGSKKLTSADCQNVLVPETGLVSSSTQDTSAANGTSAGPTTVASAASGSVTSAAPTAVTSGASIATTSEAATAANSETPATSSAAPIVALPVTPENPIEIESDNDSNSTLSELDTELLDAQLPHGADMFKSLP